MATIRFETGEDREVPDEAMLRDHGIEWFDEDGALRVVPWRLIVEFIGPSGSKPGPPTVERMQGGR